MEEEGVIKFELLHRESALPEYPILAELNAWRQILWQLELIGRHPDRYGGYGFGNVSQRTGSADASPNFREFMVSGTQTGDLRRLGASHYATVKEYDCDKNRIVSEGHVKPSSESLTHGMVYNMDGHIRVILHVHSPDIWTRAGQLGIDVTDPSVEYGTPQMAHEVERLFRETDVRRMGIFSMGGHEDGIIAFGATAAQAGNILIQAYVKSLSGVQDDSH